MLDVVAAVARQPYEGDDARQRVEFLAVIAEQVTKLRNSLDECDIDLTAEVYTSLAAPALADACASPSRASRSEGIQIMGILETRNLDFENVIILSMNDDNFPGNHMAQASFIPYNLRAAYELPTPEHHEGVYAYYFYRLDPARQDASTCSIARTPTTSRRASRAAISTSWTTRAASTCARSRWGWTSTWPRTAPIEVPKDEGVMVAAGAFRRRPKPCDALADGFFPLRGLPLALLFPFHSPLGGR